MQGGFCFCFEGILIWPKEDNGLTKKGLEKSESIMSTGIFAAFLSYLNAHIQQMCGLVYKPCGAARAEFLQMKREKYTGYIDSSL